MGRNKPKTKKKFDTKKRNSIAPVKRLGNDVGGRFNEKEFSKDLDKASGNFTKSEIASDKLIAKFNKMSGGKNEKHFSEGVKSGKNKLKAQEKIEADGIKKDDRSDLAPEVAMNEPKKKKTKSKKRKK